MGLFISGHNVGKNAASVLTLITVMYDVWQLSTYDWWSNLWFYYEIY